MASISSYFDMRSIVMVCRKQLLRNLGFNKVQELSTIWHGHSPHYIVQ